MKEKCYSLLIWLKETIAGIERVNNILQNGKNQNIELQGFNDTFTKISEELRGLKETSLAPASYGELISLLDEAPKLENKRPSVPKGFTLPPKELNVAKVLSFWVVLANKLEYWLNSYQGEEISSSSERAFEHLRRLIVVDEDYRKKWQSAYTAGEVKCEQLGAVHLLHHGLWAVKIKSTKAQTDLMYYDLVTQESINPKIIQRTSKGAILTEWKMLKQGGVKVEDLCNIARNQLKQYDGGLLGRFTLSSTRYVIIVSEDQIELKDDHLEGNVTYRHINIPVNPKAAGITAKNSNSKRKNQ